MGVVVNIGAIGRGSNGDGVTEGLQRFARRVKGSKGLLSRGSQNSEAKSMITKGSMEDPVAGSLRGLRF